jgi:hypothetical protein
MDQCDQLVPVVAANDFFHCSRKDQNPIQVIVKNLTLDREAVIEFPQPITTLVLKKQNDDTFLLKCSYQGGQFNYNLSTMFSV